MSEKGDVASCVIKTRKLGFEQEATNQPKRSGKMTGCVTHAKGVGDRYDCMRSKARRRDLAAVQRRGRRKERLRR